MGIDATLLNASRHGFSQALTRSFSSFASDAVICLDAGNSRVALSTSRRSDTVPPLDGVERVREIRACRPLTLSDAQREMLDASCRVDPTHPAKSGGKRWHAFELTGDHEITDHVALNLRRVPADEVNNALRAFWGVLRETILEDARSRTDRVGKDALLWMVSDRIDIAIIVVDAECRVVRCNAAANELLGEARAFRKRRGSRALIDAHGMRDLRAAIRACASGDGVTESIVCLEGIVSNRSVPVTVSRVPGDTDGAPLVLVTLPRPPDRERIEFLAHELGLTHAEARVASLLQLGVPNRVAARFAGLREQTFATYAKRAMNKLGVANRAELAQMLTWQAYGGGQRCVPSGTNE